MLHWLLKRWTIQRRLPDDSEWDIIGTVLGPRSPLSAVARARLDFPRESSVELRAVYWWDTTPTDRDIAIYEDARNREFR